MRLTLGYGLSLSRRAMSAGDRIDGSTPVRLPAGKVTWTNRLGGTGAKPS